MKPLYSHGLKNMLVLLSAEKLKGLADLPYGAAYGKKIRMLEVLKKQMHVYIEDDNNKIKDTLFVVYFFFLHNQIIRFKFKVLFLI